MTDHDHPPTLVDLAALEVKATLREIVGTSPAEQRLAELEEKLRALLQKRVESYEFAIVQRDLRGRNDPYWRGLALADEQTIEELRALLGDQQ